MEAAGHETFRLHAATRIVGMLLHAALAPRPIVTIVARGYNLALPWPVVRGRLQALAMVVHEAGRSMGLIRGVCERKGACGC